MSVTYADFSARLACIWRETRGDPKTLVIRSDDLVSLTESILDRLSSTEPLEFLLGKAFTEVVNPITESVIKIQVDNKKLLPGELILR